MMPLIGLVMKVGDSPSRIGAVTAFRCRAASGVLSRRNNTDSIIVTITGQSRQCVWIIGNISGGRVALENRTAIAQNRRLRPLDGG